MAGYLNPKVGYRTIAFDGVHYLAHRLVWAWFHGFNPEGEVDHSGQEGKPIKSNHIWGLIDRTAREHRQETQLNLGKRCLPMGVHLNGSGSYTSYTSVSGKQVNLGTFPDPEEALAARKGAEKIINLLSES